MTVNTVNSGGLSTEELALFEENAGPLITRLKQVNNHSTLEVSIKDREGKDQRTTLELVVDPFPKIVAVSSSEDMPHSFREVSRKALSSLNSTMEKARNH